MKVDASKLKKSSSELSIECRQLIQSISKCQTKASLHEFLSTINVWIYGKCELFHWIEILDRFDKILEDAAKYVNGNEYLLNCDSNYNEEDINLLILVLNFTTLLIEHSFSRHLYNSVEHLTKLLSSQNMCVVLAVLNLLYMFSKRSNFIPRLQFERKEMLLIKLLNIAERWGDPNYGLSLYDCCMREPKIEFLYQLSVDYIDENGLQSLLEIPDMMDLCKKTPPSEVYKNICTQISNPSDAIKMRIAHRIRLVCGFKDLGLRLQFVQARLQAVSILIYSNAIQENLDKVLYPGFGEELCELIDKKEPHLLEIRAAVLRTLTSMLHFDRNPNIPRPGTRLTKIIQYTGADRMGGILPLLVKDCISNLTKESTCFSYPLMLATSLFSLLYHLASYEAGGQALVKSGMMQSLLSVISWSGVDLEHITFVTRAVRVIDLITNIDIAKFHQNNGLNIFIDRLEKEINICRKSLSESKSSENLCSNEYQDKMDDVTEYDNAVENMGDEIPDKPLDGGGASSGSSSSSNATEGGGETVLPECSKSASAAASDTQSCSSQQGKVACLTQRAALLKSMLNFLKKSIQDHTHFNGMRNIMETSLPSSLRHIISNAEYYGPSLFLLATDVVTVYVFNEPSLLSSLQDLGLTKVMLQSLLQKDVPATREVLGSLPNVFSALCLNERGLMEFMSYKPFDKLLKVLLSSDYLVAMRRRRSSDPLGDTATNLGNAMDDLMKHHPYLRSDAIEAIVRLLNELVRLGTDSSFICWRSSKDSAAAQNAQNSNTNNDNIARDALIENTHNDSSEEDDDDEDEISSASQQQQRQNPSVEATQSMQVLVKVVEREPIPLIDFILNVMKFVEAIFNNSSNGNNDHCREFVLHGGLKPLLQLLSLPNLPVDSPVSTTAQAVANVCKSIFNIAHETKVIDMALQHLSKIVENLEPLIHNPNFADGSILLREFVCCPKLEDGFSNAEYTPLLHRMSSVHGYVIMLVHLCRNATIEMRSVLLKRWGTNAQNGLQLLKSLVQLYISLVWESTILLSLCSDEQNHEQLWEDIINKSMEVKGETGSGSSKALEKHLAKIKITPEEQTRYVKSLLAASSRLGRALAELFGTLVKLAVGTPQPKQRRTNDFQWPIGSSRYPTPDAKEIAKVLSSILVRGFKHESAFPNPPPKLKLTFLICSVGFTVPMLFDDKRNSFHLMISQFCEENGLQAFFDMFFWAISLDGSNSDFSFEKCLRNENILEESEEDSNDYPEGTGEFLDAWLQLLEKMVNPRATLESPYAIGSKFPNQDKTNVQFEPVFYLVQVHQLAMQCIRRIWTKKPIPGYGVSMTESIISILKHLIKSYSNLKERYNARVTELNNKTQDQAQKSVQTSPNELSVNPEYLKILTDMGFVRFHVIEALLNTRSLEQATEYLLNNPESSIINQQEETNMSVTNSTNDSSNEMDVDLQNLRKDSESNSISSPEQQEPMVFKNISLISDEVFEEFCEDSLEKILILMEYLPEAVTPGTELISILYRRQNNLNKNSFVNNLIKHNTNMVQEILMTGNINDCKPDDPADIFYGTHSKELYIRLKVTNILFHEIYSDIRKEICNALVWERCIELYLSLLKQTEELLNKQLQSGQKPVVPAWLHPLIEFIDSIDNVSYIIQRRVNMRSVCSDNWKWFDSSTGKWNSYSDPHNVVLKNAFNLGERSVSLSNGRQRYTVNFNSMTQVNEASGSHRIILPSLKITEAIGAYSNGTPKYDTIVTRIFRNKLETNNGEFEEECVNIESLMKNKAESNEGGAAAGTVEPSTSANASAQASASNPAETTAGATSVAAAAPAPAPAPAPEETSVSMKLFHFPQRARAMEEAAAAAAAAKRASESKGSHTKRTQKVVISEEPVGLSSYDTKNIVASLTRLLNPNLQLSGEIKISILRLCARLTREYKNAKAFYKNGGLRMLLDMQQTCNAMGFPIHAIVIIRHLLESPSILQEAIERVLTMRATPHIPVGHRDITFMLMQVSSAVSRNPAIFFDAAKQVLKADHVVKPTFLNEDYRLIVRPQASRKHLSSSSKSKQIESLQMAKDTIKDLLLAIVKPCVHYGGISSADDQANPEEKVADKIEPSCCSWHIPSTSHTHLKPILPRATILKLLADTVRSYQTLVPQLIVEHVYTPQHSVLIQKDQSFLSYVLDNFLPIITRQQDAEVSLMSRVLIISLSDCYTNSTVQSKVVEEIQDAIKRALLKTDSTEKHTRLQVLVGLLPAMIESPLLNNKVQMQRNNMYRILLKHDIMTYLAKLAQYKDLSNYNSLQTINAILRPMEILLRVTAGPANMASKRIFFGSGSQGSINRRIYPRLLARSHDPSSGVGNEHVLRDMIRNVLTDRRPTFDFVFTPEDMFMDLDDAVPTTSRSATNNLNDNRVDSNDSNATSGSRPQLNFERLWDDLLQSEEIRLTTIAPGSSSSASHNNGDHLSAAHDDVSRSNDNSGGGGSDGASTSSETGPAVAENSTSVLGDVSTSESDSDSNISTENDERNDDDEEEENDEEANDDDDVEDRSETDNDEETRQYIEVFDHIFEPGSSETASNDADVDGEDNTSEMGGAVGLENIPNNSEIGVNENSSSSHRPTHDDVETEVSMMNERPTLSEGGTSSSMEPTFNVILANHPNDNATPSSSLGSVNTTPVSQWVPSRLTFGVDGHISFSSNADVTSVNEPTNMNSENEPPAHNNTDANGHQNALCQRRDGARRMVFLDQQYCVPMPSFSCPTEESQIEMFNQDALHWWFEESKNLELESQGDACLYVAHRLIPFLIGEIKEVVIKDSKYKKSENSVQNNNAAANSRRSAIPVLIPHPPGSNVPANIGGDNEETQANPPNQAEGATALIVEETTEHIPPTANENSVDSSPEFSDNNTASASASASAHLDSVPEVEDNFVPNEEDATNECSEFSDDLPEAPQNDDDDTTNAATEAEAEAQDEGPVEEDDEVGDEEDEDEDDDDEEEDDVEEEDDEETEETVSKDLTVEEAAAVAPSAEPEEPEGEAEEEGAAGGTEVAASTSATASDSPQELDGASGVTPTAAGAAAVEVNPEIRAALGDLEVPDGVDPSFLAALPLEMREEVIQEHLRMQRIRQRSQQATLQVTNEPVLEVNPEFLAALPPNLQSEVLLQQRLEQQRQAAQTANPEDPVDTAAFFQNLPDALRQVILTDMEDSQIATLPPDLAAEAQFLRRDWETRNGSRIGNFRFPSALHNFGDDSRWHSNSIWYDAGASSHTHQQAAMLHPGQQHHGKPTALVLMEDSNNLLDPDSIATLLLFLCVEDSKMNFGRLHRVIRNLCFHLPTREWIINALMNIIQKTNEDQLEYKLNNDMKPQWLKMYVDAAFGYKANVFVINKKEHGPGYSISINPQAAQMIVRNCLDMLFFLAKNFAKSFLPYNKEKDKEKELKNRGKSETSLGGSSSSDTIEPIPLALTVNHGEPENGFSAEELRAVFYRQHHPALRGSQDSYRVDDLRSDDIPAPSKSSSRSSVSKNAHKNRNLKYNTNSKNFWDVLLNIDLSTNARLSNIQQFPLMCHPAWEWKPKNQDFVAFNESPFATLLEMLPYKVICRSPNLTDSLVKLLASLSGDLPKEEEDPPAAETELTVENLSQNEAKDSEGAAAAEATASTSTAATAASTASNEAGTSKQTTSSSSSSVPGPVLSASSLLTKNKAAVPETIRKRRMYSKNFSHLQLIIEVLTHQCGTTEGLEYVSKLIINLSLCSQAFNAIFLEYLTSAINGLACDVQNRIQTLLSEILIYNEKNAKPGTSGSSANKSSAAPVYVSQSNQLVMEDRFTSSSVIISAPKHAKPACELQLPAMKTLLSPASAQLYFLRTLKIFIQIRSIFQAQNKDNAANTPTPTLSQIICLDGLWDTLSACLKALEESKDEYAVLVLQPTVEAFFLIHANSKSKDPKYPNNTNNTNSSLDENNLNVTGEEAQANAVEGNAPEAAAAATQAQVTELIPGADLASAASPTVSDLNAENNSDSNSDIGGDGSPTDDQLKQDRLKFLNFAEKHRTVLNQILRQSNIHLSDGPFAVLVDHTRILDFDVKRKYFQTELERIDEGVRREEHTVSVRRVTVFEDSFRVLYRLGREEWKNRFYIVFEEEEGQDAGGLLREWYVIISREIFNPMYALFCVSPGDRVTYMINPSSHANPNHLSYFKFVGRVIAKAIHDNKLLECYFTRSFYKHILGKQVKYTDMESQDYEFYKGLDYLMKNDISTLGYELTFSTEVQEFGVTQVRDLIPNGRNIPVTEENKFEYVNLVCQLKMSGSIRQQLDAFLEGFYDIIPKHLISIFNEQELELLISGLPDIDIEDLKANTEYHKYTSKSSQIQWFWRALRSFDQADRAKFLQFVTGTSKVPLQGFGSLEGMNGIQKFQIHRDDRSTDRLPCAHTCFNQLDLPMYKSYEKLRSCLLKAIHECSEGFGFA